MHSGEVRPVQPERINFKTYIEGIPLGSTAWQAVSDSVRGMQLRYEISFLERTKASPDTVALLPGLRMEESMLRGQVFARQNGPDAVAYRLASQDFTQRFGTGSPEYYILSDSPVGREVGDEAKFRRLYANGLEDQLSRVAATQVGAYSQAIGGQPGEAV